MTPNLCIYHDHCLDGFAAAWVVYRATRMEFQAIEFHSATYGDAPPQVTGRNVVIVDFSYPRSVMEQLVRDARSVLVLDHHKTAHDALHDLPGAHVVFDLNRSGARIAWDHYFPYQPTPNLLLHIEDRDLWRFELDGTRDVVAGALIQPRDFATWSDLMGSDTRQLRHAGAIINRKHDQDLDELLPLVTRPLEIFGHIVPAANLPPMFASDAGHRLAQHHRFAATYYDVPGSRIFSLRSAPDGADVAAIAQQYGGGGHPHAAGFRVTLAYAQLFELPDP